MGFTIEDALVQTQEQYHIYTQRSKNTVEDICKIKF